MDVRTDVRTDGHFYLVASDVDVVVDVSDVDVVVVVSDVDRDDLTLHATSTWTMLPTTLSLTTLPVVTNNQHYTFAHISASLKSTRKSTRSPAVARDGRPHCPINLILTLNPSLINF